MAAALRTWLTTLAQGAVWSVLLWLAAAVLLAGGALAAFFGSFLGLVHSAGGVTPFAHTHLITRFVGLFFALVLAAVLLFPFLLAGALGLWGAAVRGESVTARRFWSSGRTLYGRGWSLVLYYLVYGIAYSTVTTLLAAYVGEARGSLLGLVALVLSLPWVVRTVGGLFVSQRSWAWSIRRSFRGPAYPTLLLGGVLALLAEVTVLGAALLVIRGNLAVGVVVYASAVMGLALVVPVWYLALYHAENALRPPEPEVEEDPLPAPLSRWRRPY